MDLTEKEELIKLVFARIKPVLLKRETNRLEILAKAVVKYCNKDLNESEGQDMYDKNEGWKEIISDCFLPALKLTKGDQT